MRAISEKKILRAAMRDRRAELAAAMPDHASRLAGHAPDLEIAGAALVGGYIALAGEADPSILMARLSARGATLALPRVVAKGAPLAYHSYETGAELAPGAYGILEPRPSAPSADPQIILVPLLAFDATGHRLGYGGGYYDRTLSALRARHPVMAVGVAYAGQEVEKLPRDAFDEPLDMLVTEQGLRRFGAAG
jgi:5-formyltetrahydrofolate cyclo-ligase